MQNQYFRKVTNLLSGHQTYVEAYAAFLHTGNIPLSLEDDVYRLHQQAQPQSDENSTEVSI